MARVSSKQSNFKIKFICIVSIIAILALSCIWSTQIENALGIGKVPAQIGSYESVSGKEFQVHYIDVGQGDSTLIKFPDGKTMLIDAGEEEYGDDVVTYLQKENVTKLDYFVLTHSDSDHVGGAQAVLEAFEVQNIYRPFQLACEKSGAFAEDEALATAGYIDFYTETYTDFSYSKIDTIIYNETITAIYEETYTTSTGKTESNVFVNYDGLEIIGSSYTVTWYAPEVYATNVQPMGDIGYPTKYYSNPNDYSPIINIVYAEESYLFTGDAGTAVEKDFLERVNGGVYTAEQKQSLQNVLIYKAGHHGSGTSSTEDFLKFIQPKFIVVSCGLNNKYKHPNSSFLQRAQEICNVTEENGGLLRTDKQGNIAIGAAQQESNATIYASGQAISIGERIRWWQICLGIGVILTIAIISVKGKVTYSKVKKSAKKAGDAFRG